MAPQATIRRSTDWVEGMQLDQDASARIRFHPAEPGAGIVFVRSDLPGESQVSCTPENVRSMPRWTALEQNGAWVHHTEHILAALGLCGVDNVHIEMDSERIPMLDGGTCAAFAAALDTAGQRVQDAPRMVYRLSKPAFYLDREDTTGAVRAQPSVEGGRYIAGFPDARFSVTTVFHWSHMPSLPIGVAEFEPAPGVQYDELLRARSYVVEGEQVRDVLGSVQDAVMQLYPGCPSTLAIEAARHKIVDFIGDLMILGRSLRGRFMAVRAGHRLHHEFTRHLVAGAYLELVADE